MACEMGMSFHEFSLVYDIEVTGFYELHHCTLRGTNELFLKINLLHKTVVFNEFICCRWGLINKCLEQLNVRIFNKLSITFLVKLTDFPEMLQDTRSRLRDNTPGSSLWQCLSQNSVLGRILYPYSISETEESS